MSYKRYRLFTAITMVIVAATVIGIILRKRVRELAVDERVTNISEKALAFASGVFLIVAAPIGLTLVALGWESSSDLYVIGLTITFTVCGIALFYYAANLYYNRKYSGKK